MKKVGRLQKKTFLSIILILSLMILSSCYVGRFFWWNFADLNDSKKFPALDIKKGDYTFYFKRLPENKTFQIPGKFNPGKKFNDFDEFLQKKKTVSFIVIKNDTVLYENYFAGYCDSSVITTFSASKSVISALVGIALEEGYIYSTNEPVTKYIPELVNPGFDKITIENLLNMRSGIKFTESYSSPFADMPKYYYGTNLLKYIKKLKVKEEAGKRYDYLSVNTILLGLIIERATNTKLNKYVEEKLWKPLGMQYDASWSIDSKKHEVFKANCCLNGRSIDYAKFGRLYLNKGKWEGKQIVPREWVERSTSIINDSRDSQGYPYTYQWRVLENGAFFAKGILGQYIFVYPAKNLIFVRQGKGYGKIDWADFFSELSKKL